MPLWIVVKTESHLMVLLVGNKVQKFQGDDDYQSDSLGVLLDNKSYPASYIDSREKGIPFSRSSTKWSVYLGYPEGKVSIADRVFIDKLPLRGATRAYPVEESTRTQ